MAYCVDIYSFPHSIEYEFKWAGDYGAKGEKRAPRERPSPWQIELQNQINKKNRIRRTIKANFMENDFWLTFTYRKGERKDMQGVKEDLNIFSRKLQRRYKRHEAEMKWMRTIEIGSRGGIHIHLILNRIRGADADIMIKECWPHGRVFFSNLYEEGGYEQLAQYMAKVPDEEERKKKGLPRKLTKEEYSYSTSRNLIRPKPERKRYRRWTVRKLLIYGPKPTPGYYIVPESIRSGTNRYTGYSYMRYTEEKLDRRI